MSFPAFLINYFSFSFLHPKRELCISLSDISEHLLEIGAAPMLLALSPGGIRREWASAATVTPKQEGPAAPSLASHQLLLRIWK